MHWLTQTHQLLQMRRQSKTHRLTQMHRLLQMHWLLQMHRLLQSRPQRKTHSNALSPVGEQSHRFVCAGKQAGRFACESEANAVPATLPHQLTRPIKCPLTSGNVTKKKL